MARFDRYMLSQLMLLFGFFALVLVLVYWINRAVILFDQLIANGQTAWVFLEFTALTLPMVISIVLPVATFVASVFVTNRLSSESELVVAEAAGYSPFRLARPVLAFGLITAVFVAILNHLLVPMSQERLAERRDEISRNITTRFLTEGTFVHPVEGVTFYIRSIGHDGEMRDLFLSDARQDGERFTYTARRALVVRTEDGPKLVMFDGMAQILHLESNRLTVTAFEDFAYDVGALIDARPATEAKLRFMSTRALLAAAPDDIARTGSSPAEFRFEAHNRSAQALLSVFAAMTGFSMLMLGGFSRLGLWPQILGAVVLLIVIKTIDNSLAPFARREAGLFWLVYAASAIGLGMNAVILWASGRPALFAGRRRRREARS